MYACVSLCMPCCQANCSTWEQKWGKRWLWGSVLEYNPVTIMHITLDTRHPLVEIGIRLRNSRLCRLLWIRGRKYEKVNNIRGVIHVNIFLALFIWSSSFRFFELKCRRTSFTGSSLSLTHKRLKKRWKHLDTSSLKHSYAPVQQ